MIIYSIHQQEFTRYGRVIENPFNDVFESAQKELAIPETGAMYKANVGAFETKETMSYYRGYFGDMDVQIGYCWGRNDTMNALEWHKSSEINIALEDMILLLGDIRDIENGLYNSENLKVFFVKKGEAIELYSTTLHFCPCSMEGKVFKCIVILPLGTNTPLDKVGQDKKLIAKNKWLICHSEAKKHVDMGRVIGITGENIVVK